MREKISILFLGSLTLLIVGAYLAFSKDVPQPQFRLPPRNSITEALKSKKISLRDFNPDEAVTLIAAGDIMLSRNVAVKIREKKDFNYPFLKIRDWLKQGDMAFANLEAPITNGREIKEGEMVFRVDGGGAEALKDAGINVLSLANNHIPNFGEKGILDTVERLDKVSIRHAGAGGNEVDAGRPAILEIKGLKFAFLAYNDPVVVPKSYEAGPKHAGTSFMNVDRMREAVTAAKSLADFVIVSMHSGTEYSDKISARQSGFARAAIDAGAEMVIGHHPHVVQKIEKYKDKYIFYSLGNFVFDQMFSMPTREGMTVKVVFDKDGVAQIEFVPVLIEDYAQPRIVGGKEADEALKRLQIDELAQK